MKCAFYCDSCRQERIRQNKILNYRLPPVQMNSVKHFLTILLWSPWKYRCGQRTVRLAVVACSQKQRCLRAQAH
ncbi:hypothetical protein TNCV_4016441 [Trichonephila clavipes]|nr:hypothetical protein TNCV_4016441 [Trichonephila clavipes]